MPTAVILNGKGDADGFSAQDVAPPAPGPTDLVMSNRAIGVNFIDIYQRKGLYPVSFPAVLGQEAVGVIEAVGDSVQSFSPGVRVAYLCDGGGYAAQTKVDASRAVHIPDDVDDETAASVFLKGLTVQMLVRQVYPLANGDACLVYAAAGGVGSLLCQWAAHIGARVIAVVGTAEKVAIARAAGASDVINRADTDDIAAAVRRLTDGQGVDVVYDSVGAATFDASLKALRPRGMMVSYGNASGPAPAIAPLVLAQHGSIFLARPVLHHFATPDRLPAMAQELFALISAGIVRPQKPTVFSLTDVAEAHRLLESGASVGSIILTP